jgi:hypothetical protein
MTKALDLATGDLYLSLFVGTTNTSLNGVVTIQDGGNDLNIASHDGTNGLKLEGDLVTSTAAELNIMDGVTVTSTDINGIVPIATIQSEANEAGVILGIALG